jgi:methyl-accepting chemotaxis protein
MMNQWTVGKKITAGYALALFLLVVIGGVAFTSLFLLTNNSWWVAHTHEVLEKLEGIQSLLIDAETGQRGFLLTRDTNYLKPFKLAESAIPIRLDKVKELTSDNDSQQRRLEKFRPLVERQLLALKDSIDASAKLGASAPDEKSFTATLDQGKERMDRIRDEIAALQQAEKELLVIRGQREASTVLWTQVTIGLGTLASFIGVFVVGTYITRGITGPLGTLTEMSRKIADGDLRQQKLAIASQDETGQLAGVFNGMLDSLRDLTAQTTAITSPDYSSFLK